MNKNQQGERRKMLAVRGAHHTQDLMQIYWMHALRRSGLGFQGAYYTATALAWIWYAWERAKIELTDWLALS